MTPLTPTSATRSPASLIAPLILHPTLLTSRKRRRWWSRSVFGRSSDRSDTCRASAAYPTCSDLPLAAGGTDSSGELFNGEGSCWGSDASEVRVTKKEEKENGGSLERESAGSAMYQGVGGVLGATKTQGNESGYGSELGYRVDGELGYDDEIDEKEDDGRMLFWGERLGGGEKKHKQYMAKDKVIKVKACEWVSKWRNGSI